VINRHGRRKREKEREGEMNGVSKISNFNTIHYARTIFPAVMENKKRKRGRERKRFRRSLLCSSFFLLLLAGSLNLGIAVSDRTEISRTVRIDVGVVEGGGGGGRVETKEKGRERVGLGT